MGDGKKSGSGFRSVMASWFAFFRLGKAVNTTYRGAAGEMVAAANHFSSAHKIHLG
jgi:hypothetical protein